MSVDAHATVADFTAALTRGDLEACRALVSDDLVFSEPASLPFGGEHHGWDSVVDMLSLLGRRYKLRLDPPVMAVAGAQAFVRMSGAISSRTTGRAMALNALDVYEVDESSRIIKVDVYYKDVAAVLDLDRTDDHG